MKEKPKAEASSKQPAKPPPKKARPAPKPKKPSREDAIRLKARELFSDLDVRYQAAAAGSNFDRLNSLFAALTVLVIAGLAAAWLLVPMVTWWMALSAAVVVLILLGVPLMRSQKTFIHKVSAACFDEEASNLPFVLACTDSWLETLDDARRSGLLRKELDRIIGRHAEHMEKMMDYACILAQEPEAAPAPEDAAPEAPAAAQEAEAPASGDEPPSGNGKS